MEEHNKSIQSLCRVCSRKLGRTSYSSGRPAAKGSTTTLIEEAFWHDFSSVPGIDHPRFCHACYSTMTRMQRAKVTGTVYRTSLTLHIWTEHQDGNCSTCSMEEQCKIGGRPKITKNILGCPNHLIEHMKSVAGPKYKHLAPLSLDRFGPGINSVCIADVTCRSCGNVLDEPVELECTHLLCCLCCLQLLQSYVHSISCPYCQVEHPVAESSFRQPTGLVNILLKGLVVKCERKSCDKVVPLSDLQVHINSRCAQHSTQHSITLDHIMQQPSSAPPTQAELAAAGHIVQKILAQLPTQTFNLPSGHQVSSPLQYIM